jgi:hypothetical protein
MDISQASDYFNDLANKVQESQRKAALVAAGNALVLIKERVIGTGENSDGAKFKDYSDTALPSFFIKSRTGSDKLKKKVEKKIGSKASYKDIREQAGLQTEHRDFKFTSRMWNNIIPQVIEMNNGNVSIAIKARDPQEQQKVEWNIQESGNFLEPSKQELQKAEEYYNDYFIQELLK